MLYHACKDIFLTVSNICEVSSCSCTRHQNHWLDFAALERRRDVDGCTQRGLRNAVLGIAALLRVDGVLGLLDVDIAHAVLASG